MLQIFIIILFQISSKYASLCSQHLLIIFIILNFIESIKATSKAQFFLKQSSQYVELFTRPSCLSSLSGGFQAAAWCRLLEWNRIWALTKACGLARQFYCLGTQPIK